jgi:hypothetical protein
MTLRSTFHLGILLVGSLMMLMGCGNGGNGEGITRSGGADIGRMTAGLEPGEFDLDITGFVVSTGPYTGDGPAARFEPRTYTASRERADGFGGRERVDTWNATGPYRIWLHSAVSRDGGEEEMATTWVQLPPDARAGQTYTIRHSRMARQGEAYAGLQRRDMVWSETARTLEGEITVGEIGDYLTASFHFHNGREDDQRIEITGRVHRAPYLPRGEAFFTYTRDGETEEVADRLVRQAQDHRFEVWADLVGFSFGPDPQPGTYQLAPRRDWDNRIVGVSGGGVRMDSVDGSVELTEQDGYFTMNFQFAAEGPTPVSAQGRFEWVRVP